MCATFFGRSIWVAPGLPLSAYLNASRQISEIVSGLMTTFDRLVMGLNMAERSRYWWLVNCMSSLETCPVMATSGAPSRNASATPVTRFVAPGPSVARQTPARPVRRP